MAFAVAACGGAQSEPKEPESAAAEPAPAKESSSKDESDTADTPPADEPKKTDAAEPAPAEEPKKAGKSPADVLKGDDVMFAFAFNASEAYQSAEKKCGEKAKDDPKKKADCMRKASDQISADDISFKKDADGKWWWLTTHRKGNTLVTVHKIQVEFVDETDKSVTLKPQGRDTGTKPMQVPAKVVVEVPSESEIVLTDPKLGKMVYQAKMGLTGKSER